MSHLHRSAPRFLIVGAPALAVVLCGLPTNIATSAPPSLTPLSALQSPNPENGDLYGSSVAVQGGYTAVVMTNGRDKVLVYDTYTGQLRWTLSPNGPAQDFGFGNALAIDGNLLIVNAQNDDVQSSGGTLYNTGAAYVYDLTTGQQVSRLVPNDATSYTYLDAVAIDGTHAVLGGGNSQAAYLFDAITGQQLAKFTPSLSTAGFGDALAIDGKTLVVGQSDYHTDSALYVYDIEAKTEMQRIVPQDAAIGDGFGVSVDLDGSRAIVGSPENDASYTNSGAAYVFDVTTGQELAKLLPPVASGTERSPAFFGASVAINGNSSVVGASRFKRGDVSTGGAFVFDWQSNAAIYDLVPNVAASRSFFGQSVAMDGNTIVVGATRSDGPGAAYIFAVPEPSTLLLLGVGAISLLGYRKAKSHG
jgi:hypothetical protein